MRIGNEIRWVDLIWHTLGSLQNGWAPALGSPGPGQVNIKVEAGPINPAELLLIEGKYASRPPLPARLGIEGVVTITAVGEGVNELAIGDRVMSLGRTNWAEEIQVSSGAVVKVP